MTYNPADLYGFKGIKHHYYYLYICHYCIQARCTKPHDPHYYLYGGRGIRLYEEWLFNPTIFGLWVLNNLGPRPIDKSLDRQFNDGHYVPGNLRWATRSEQNFNRRKPSRNQSGVLYDQLNV